MANREREDSMTGPDMQAFGKFGYRIARGLLDRETLADVLGFLREEMEQVCEVLRSCGVRIEGPEDPNAAASIAAAVSGPAFRRFGKLERDTLSGNFLQTTRLSERLWRIVRRRRLQSALRDILDTRRLYMHMLPSARYVLPGNGHAGVPAHRDMGYNGHLTDFVTVWVPLVEIDDACGGVRVFEDSAEDAPRSDEPPRMLDNGLWLAGVETGAYQARDSKFSPGDALFLDKNVVHESRPNTSTRTRYSIDFRFFGENATTTKHYLDMQEWKVVAPGDG